MHFLLICLEKVTLGFGWNQTQKGHELYIFTISLLNINCFQTFTIEGGGLGSSGGQLNIYYIQITGVPT